MAGQQQWPPAGLSQLGDFGGPLLSKELKQIRDVVSIDSRAKEIAVESCSADALYRSDFSTSSRTDGTLRLRRFYWSVQRQINGRFAARSFAYYRKAENRGQWFDFPNDPDLPRASDVLTGMKDFTVLRYIPLRRLTVLTKPADAEPVVIKFKRMERFAEAAKLLGSINTAIAQYPVSFATPQLLQIDHETGMISQTYVPGSTLSTALLREKVTFVQLVQVLAELTAIQIGGLPNMTHGNILEETKIKANWIAQIFPEAVDDLHGVVETLAQTMPDEAEMVFCHGDMGAEQIIIDVLGKWALLDFDRAHLGNPHRDLANLIVKWRRDKGLEISIDDILNVCKAQQHYPIEKKALNWHIACLELHHLQQIFKKARATRPLVQSAIGRVKATCLECHA
jgi:aminoglycoside phosphotransferase (APT) family kinase protein